MAKKISELPDSSAANGNELIPVVQDGITVRMVLSKIKDYLLSFFSASTGASLIGYTTAGTGAVPTTVQTKLREIVSVKDFGAVGDGVSDDWTAFNNAVSFCKNKGKALYVPEGSYLLNSDNGSIVLEEVSVLGSGVLDGATPQTDKGSVICITGTTNAPFKIRRGVQLKGLGFFYPNQADSATPAAYPPTLDFDFSNGPVQFVFIEENSFVNSYHAIRIGDPNGNAGHIFISKNTIYGIYCGIEVTKNLEIIKITENTFTFGHWLQATESGCRAYTRSNGIAFKYDSGDGFWFSNNLVFGYFRGISITGGQVVLSTILGNSFDQVRYPIFISSSGNLLQSNIVSNLFLAFNNVDKTKPGIAIYSLSTNDIESESINIVSNYFGQCTSSQIVLDNPRVGRLNIVGNLFEYMGFSQTSGIYSAVSLNAPNKVINVSNNYIQASNSVDIYAIVCYAANVLNISNNTIAYAKRAVVVSSAGQVALTGNVSFGTTDSISDDINGVTGEIWQTGNKWDKPSGRSTKPAFLVQKGSQQTFNSSVATDVTWEVKIFDKGNNFSSNSFVAPYKGKYRFYWTLFHDNTGTAGDRWQFLLNAGPVMLTQSYKMINDYNSVVGGGLLELDAGSVVKLQIRRVGGTGNFVTYSDGTANYFCGELIE